MSRKPLVVLALAVLVAGALAVAYAASSPEAAHHGVIPPEPHLAQAYPRAAAAAYGRRVLVLRTGARGQLSGEVLESARVGSGWELHPGAPADATEFARGMSELSVEVARDWRDGRALSAATVDALARGGVAIVVIEDGRSVVTPDPERLVEGLAPEPTVPALRVRGAEPVLRVTGEEAAAGGSRVRLEPALVRDLRDGLYGGAVVVEAREPGTFVFAWPREGAHVTVGGRDVAPREPVTELPLVVLDLPAGDSEVEVTYGGTGGPAPWAIGGALAIVGALVTLLLALRPHPGAGDET